MPDFLVFKKKIYQKGPVFIVFEAGATHDGLNTAKKLVDVASEAGADAVKFQMLNPDKLVSSKEVLFTYTILNDKNTGQTENVTEPLQDILHRRYLTFDEFSELIDYCREKQIGFFSTVTSEEEVEFLRSKNVEMVKICSGDITYHKLLKLVAKHDWIVQIDTGSSTISEVEEAIDVLEKNGCHKIIINHCPSGYPAEVEAINLRVIETLNTMFPYPVAFSDHSPGWDMDIAAVSLGVTMVEKNITLDRTIRSPEHIMSLEPDDAKTFVQTMRLLEKALGSTRRLMTEEERKRHLVARRSLYLAKDIRKGEIITEQAMEYMRPGDGIPANLDYLVIGRKAVKDLKKGHKITFGDFE